MEPLSQLYRVGGWVRDHLLGLPAPDCDWLVLGETPERMLARGFQQVGADFPVFLHPESGEEYALARQERKIAPGYRGFQTVFSPTVTIEEDLLRRDLTINAMAMDGEGRLIDPYGGFQDLQHRVLRHVSPAFAEDPLRVLRVARFLARFAGMGFQVAEETRQLMKTLVDSGELHSLAPERVWQETRKALLTDHPVAYFALLAECGALAVWFTELAALRGVQQAASFHPEGDAWQHACCTLQAACRLTADPELRFAALVHDLGKGLTPKEQWPRHIGHEQSGLLALQSLAERLRLPKRLCRLALAVIAEHLRVQRVAQMRPATVVKVLQRLRAFSDPDFFQQVLLACRADILGRGLQEEGADVVGELWLQCRDAAAQVDILALQSAGWQGRLLGEAIYRQRIVRVRQILLEQRAVLQREMPC
ncbi:multifunctional CCA addition/repair protein [Candidatus Magnetaquicoccus inordinatus]|uniref:multifunctional CCA addition/repair protein n=1 Tax=Candidatus Magnetaquicoccus inordinatus TaxID=2496818 RepID=UPI00102CF414|nr:multifunctional CCA addition/repair protein [Candidatus Magnetaquicoccus inordinatus]